MLKRTFDCMASNCEILLETSDPILMNRVEQVVATEARRIEAKYSRYRDDSVISQIQKARGTEIDIDPETAQLLDFAFQCFQLSEGLIDITTGVLRRIWSFKTTDAAVPTQKQINSILQLVGLSKVEWRKHDGRARLRLPEGMELDFGGLGKEYAVDRCARIAANLTSLPCLINFGGDLAALRAPSSGSWRVGIEGTDKLVSFTSGGLATSGDQKRFLKSGDVIYSHILNPLTGWAVTNSCTSVTVQSDTCTNAGILSTLAHLQKDPVAFLSGQDVRFWIN